MNRAAEPHSQLNIGSFTTAPEPSQAYELEYAKIQQQIPRDLPRDNEQRDPLDCNHAQQHSQPSLYDNKGKRDRDRVRHDWRCDKANCPQNRHIDRAECNSKRAYTAATQDNFMKKDDSSMKASALPITHATVGIGCYDKPDSGAVTPPLDMFENLTVTEQIYSSGDNSSETTISNGAGLTSNRSTYGRHLPLKIRMTFFISNRSKPRYCYTCNSRAHRKAAI